VPITPFHFGLGGLITAASRAHVSFLAFCASNLVIDVESVYNIVMRQPRIHTFLHTYIGASLAAAFVVVAFFPARSLAKRVPPSPRMTWQFLPIRAVVLGAVLGGWTHVLLDSVMHGDITPFAPFSNANTLHGVISLVALHVSCAIAGAVGLLWWFLRSNTSPEHSNEK